MCVHLGWSLIRLIRGAELLDASVSAQLGALSRLRRLWAEESLPLRAWEEKEVVGININIYVYMYVWLFLGASFSDTFKGKPTGNSPYIFI